MEFVRIYQFIVGANNFMKMTTLNNQPNLGAYMTITHL